MAKTCADAWKCGLRLQGRASLNQLIEDVVAGKADFDAVLVYDVCRWRRFQDTDESAYHWLEREDVHACLEYARRLVAHERVEVHPVTTGS